MKKEYPLGALRNNEDNRDISLASVAMALGVDTAIHPKKNITDISMMPLENQQDKGTCVGQAEGKDGEFQNFIETKKVTRISKRLLYTQCKLIDGNVSQGTYPRVAASVRVNSGLASVDLVPDDNSLPYSEYLKVSITPAIKTDASGRRSKGYSFPMTLDEVKTAIDITHAFNATLMVGDWSTLPVKPKFADGTNRGQHRIWVYGYEDAMNNGVEDTKVYFRNSWDRNWANGKTVEDRMLLSEGNGYFWWSEYIGNIFDMICYLDMPNTIIDYARSQQFIFTRVLKRGMQGTDVIELQKRLTAEIASDGLPCYQSTVYDVNFGPVTEKAVQRYQASRGLVNSGTPSTTGYGQVGPLTMKKLNEGTIPVPEKKSLLNKWADAIQSFEGWYKGSKSYRNNNPGNIRFIGQKRATGQDSTGFCIFATYADGRQELIDLLTRAASGKSSLYSPNMTLIDFYNRYAPTSDNNYPEGYAKAVAKMMNISVYSKIKDILNDTATLTTIKTTQTNMKNITSSASKLVLLYIVAILGLLALMAGGYSIFTNTFGEASKICLAAFGVALNFVLGFYFGYKGDPVQPSEEAGNSRSSIFTK